MLKFKRGAKGDEGERGVEERLEALEGKVGRVRDEVTGLVEEVGGLWKRLSDLVEQLEEVRELSLEPWYRRLWRKIRGGDRGL